MKKFEIAVFKSKSRLEAFSDGVFAIIITIMVLEIKSPNLPENFSKEQFIASLYQIFPHILSYAISFIIVGVYWVNHHNFIESLKQVDGKFMWWNLHLLFWLSLVPIPTAFLGEHPKSPWALMAFGAILLMCGISFALMGGNALFKSKLIDENYSENDRKKIFNQNFPGIILCILAIVLAPVSIYISWLIFFIVPLLYFFPRTLEFTQIFE